MLAQIIARVRALAHRRQIQAEADDELRFHLEEETAANIASGMTPGDARRAAIRAFGGITQARERIRATRSTWIDALWRDSRSALRQLFRHAPLHTAVVVLTLGLGIGVGTAVFSVLDSVLWNRTPFRDSGRLAEIWSHHRDRGFSFATATREQVLLWREQSDLFEQVEAYEPALMVYQTPTGAELVTGTLVTSLVMIYSADRGLNPTGLVTLRIGLPAAGYTDVRARDRFVLDALDALRGMPGVRSASEGALPPEEWKILFGAIEIEGQTAREGHVRRGVLYEVSPDYFATVGIPILQGSTFSSAGPSEPVIVGEQFARDFWPQASAVGRRLRMDNGPWRTVIGVAGDVRRASIEPVASSAQVYHLAGRTYEAGVGMSVERASILVADRHLAVRLADAPPSREVLVAAIHRVDPSVVVRRIRSADDIVAGEASRSRLVFFLMTGFALFALAIAAAGLFGLLSSLVDHRRREIGIRLALGARPGGIARRLVAHALLLTTGGVIAGMLGSMGLVRFLRAELYGVEPSDPVAIIAACALLVTTASLAAWWPAARAMRIDPAALLRSE